MHRNRLYLLFAFLGFTLLVLLVWGALAWVLPRALWNEEPDVYATLISRRVTPTARGASAPPPTATPNRAAVARALVEGDWQDRVAMASSLATRQEIPASERATMLLSALEQEVNHPTGAPQPATSYLSTSSRIRIALAESLSGLGPEGLAVWQQAATVKTGAVREWIVVGLGCAGLPEVAPSLRELLRKSANGDARMVAARILGTLGVRDAVPELKQALKDPFSVKVGADASSVNVFPVREAAAGALEKLGVSVRRAGDAGFVVVE